MVLVMAVRLSVPQGACMWYSRWLSVSLSLREHACGTRDGCLSLCPSGSMHVVLAMAVRLSVPQGACNVVLAMVVCLCSDITSSRHTSSS